MLQILSYPLFSLRVHFSFIALLFPALAPISLPRLSIFEETLNQELKNCFNSVAGLHTSYLVPVPVCHAVPI